MMIPTPLEITKALIQFQTVNPPGDEESAQRYLRDLLEDAGFSVQLYETEAGRPNLVTRLSGAGKKPPLLFYGHTDVVGVDGQQWQFPPFDAVEKDGILYGRGALDMKAGVAMLVHSLLRAAKEGVQPAGDIVLLIVADEETGGSVGMQYLLAEHPEIFEGIRHAIGEFGGFPLYVGGRKFYRIGVSQKQYARIRLTLRAAGGHGSLPVGDTVMGKLGAALTKLDNHKLSYTKSPLAERIIQTMQGHVEDQVAEAFEALLHPDTFDSALAMIPSATQQFESLFRDTANPTIVAAGRKFNVIPSEAVVDIDARILPGHSADDLVHELHQLLGGEVAIDIIAAGPQTKPDVDYALFDLLADLLRTHDPDAIPIPYLFNESPDGRLLEDHGIQNYGYLPMDLPPEIDLPSIIHGENERVPTAAIAFGANVLFDLICRY